MTSFPTWIKLPNLHLEFLPNSSMHVIDEALGKFIASENIYETCSFFYVAQILVELDPQQGMFETISLEMGDSSYTQVLDYVNMPLMCARCHKVVQILSDCELKF